MTLQLKVTSIERYHLCDDTRENPNVIGCELVVSGIVNQDVATAALRETAKRHPFVYARCRGRSWSLDPAAIRQLTWQVLPDPFHPGGSPDLRYIDLRSEGPCRFLLRPIGDRTQLSFRTHHAALDGQGGLQFVIDWLLTYQRLASQKTEPASRHTRPELLNRRNHLRLLSRQFIGKLWVQPIAMLGAIKFLFRKVQPLVPAATASDRSLPADFQVWEFTCTPEQTQALKQQAMRGQVTTNELILKAVFEGLHEFRKHKGLQKPKEWLRLIIPISIRDFADRRLPAANRATIVQLDRRDRDFANPEGLLWGLNYELRNIKKWNLEKTFLLLMRGFSRLPGLLERSIRKDVCRATSVVTNLGAPFERVKLERIDGQLRSGNLVVEDVSLIAPLRPRTSVGFAVLRYAGQQKICLHYDPLQVTGENAKTLLQLVAGNLVAANQSVENQITPLGRSHSQE